MMRMKKYRKTSLKADREVCGGRGGRGGKGRFHVDVTLISLRFHFDFTWISLRVHVDFTSVSL